MRITIQILDWYTYGIILWEDDQYWERDNRRRIFGSTGRGPDLGDQLTEGSLWGDFSFEDPCNLAIYHIYWYAV